MPQILLTILGFYFIYNYIQPAIKEASLTTSFLKMTKGKYWFWIVLMIVCFLFTYLKFELFGFEGRFEWHYLVINLTSGIVFSVLFTPLLFLIKEKGFH